MRIMGCLCYDFHDKFTPKSVCTIFMGYAPTQKGYKMSDIVANKFIVSRDVVFKEGIFSLSILNTDLLLFFTIILLSLTQTCSLPLR